MFYNYNDLENDFLEKYKILEQCEYLYYNPSSEIITTEKEGNILLTKKESGIIKSCYKQYCRNFKNGGCKSCREAKMHLLTIKLYDTIQEIIKEYG